MIVKRRKNSRADAAPHLPAMRSAVRVRLALPARHRGAALLVFMLIMLTAVSGVLIERVSARAAVAQKRSAEATRALAAAKTALIAYAVTDASRPGELPCPDVDRDGQSLPTPDYPGANCASRLGWFPYRSLDMPELRDDSGARLWYAVAENYRSNSTVVLNSETAASLSVDGTAEVVAVIIAPGEASQTQTRPTDADTPNAATDFGEFLENVNADGNLDTYESASGDPFSDRVMIITRAELMREVEKRVVGEVLGTLRTFRATHDVFPWPVAYSNPRDLAEFAGSPGIVSVPGPARSEGLVPLHGRFGSSLPLGFKTGFVVSWSGWLTLR